MWGIALLVLPFLLVGFLASAMLFFALAKDSIFFTVALPLCLAAAAVMLAIDAWRARRS